MFVILAIVFRGGCGGVLVDPGQNGLGLPKVLVAADRVDEPLAALRCQLVQVLHALREQLLALSDHLAVRVPGRHHRLRHVAHFGGHAAVRVQLQFHSLSSSRAKQSKSSFRKKKRKNSIFPDIFSH